MSTIRCYVKVDGELVHDESFVNDRRELEGVSYPGLSIGGKPVEVGFDFDPPLVKPLAAEQSPRCSGCGSRLIGPHPGDLWCPECA
jgi:hypothetical protein